VNEKAAKIITALGRMTEWSLYGIIFSLPVSKTAIEVCATIAIASWVCAKLLSGREGMRLARTDLDLPIAAFYLISFLSILWSTHPSISISAFWSKTTEYILLYFITVETFRDKRMMRNAMLFLAASVLLIGADGIYQKIVGRDLLRGYELHSMERLTCSFPFPNGLSSWLVVVSYPVIAMAAYYKGDVKVRVTALVFAALIAFLAYFGFTRAAFLSFAGALAVMLLLKGGRASIIVLVLLAVSAASVMFLVPDEIRSRIYVLKLFSGSSAEHRIIVWKTALRMFMERPLLGQGLNTFMANYERFRAPGDSGIWYAHNSYLQVAAELGIAGFLSFSWLAAKIVWTSVVSWNKIADSSIRIAYLGLFCGITAFLILSLFEVTHYSLQSAVLFYLSIGILMALKKIGLNEYGKV